MSPDLIPLRCTVSKTTQIPENENRTKVKIGAPVGKRKHEMFHAGMQIRSFVEIIIITSNTSQCQYPSSRNPPHPVHSSPQSLESHRLCWKDWLLAPSAATISPSSNSDVFQRIFTLSRHRISTCCSQQLYCNPKIDNIQC